MGSVPGSRRGGDGTSGLLALDRGVREKHGKEGPKATGAVLVGSSGSADGHAARSEVWSSLSVTCRARILDAAAGWILGRQGLWSFKLVLLGQLAAQPLITSNSFRPVPWSRGGCTWWKASTRRPVGWIPGFTSAASVGGAFRGRPSGEEGVCVCVCVRAHMCV